MAILAECDICGNQHRVKDGLAGGSIRCKDCGVTISIPFDHQISPSRFLEVGGRLQRREAVPGFSLGPWMILIAVVTLVIVTMVAAVWIIANLIRLADLISLKSLPVCRFDSEMHTTGRVEVRHGRASDFS